MQLCNFGIWVTQEFLRRHGNRKPKRFDVCIKCKPINWTCQFHHQRLDIFGLLEEIDKESGVAFLKSFSIYITHNHAVHSLIRKRYR